jgi:hypothetical protein
MLDPNQWFWGFTCFRLNESLLLANDFSLQSGRPPTSEFSVKNISKTKLKLIAVKSNPLPSFLYGFTYLIIKLKVHRNQGKTLFVVYV